MASIVELYDKIYRALDSVQRENAQKKKDIQHLLEIKSSAIHAQVQQHDKDIEKLQAYKNPAAAYVPYNITKETVIPAPADQNYLESLYRSAIAGQGDWAKIYRVAAAGIAWIERLKKQIVSASYADDRLKNTYDADSACRRILDGDDVQQLLHCFIELDRAYAPALIISQPYVTPSKNERPPFGKVAMSFPVTDGCRNYAKRILGVYFLEDTKEILIPGVIPNVALIQTHTSLVEKVMSGIRAYVLNVLLHSIPVQRQIYYIDTCKLDKSCLGFLQCLSEKSESIIVPIADSIDSAKRQLADLRNGQTNSQDERVLVFRYRQEVHDHTFESSIQWLCTNATQYHLHIIIVQEIANDAASFEKLIPWYIPNDAKILRSEQNKYLIETDHMRRIAWYMAPQSLPHKLQADLCKVYEPAPLLLRYFDIQPPKAQYQFHRDRKKPISLLYGVSDAGKQYSLDLRGMDFAAYILGESGSGKSNMLNILITSAILNYHPDDLEIWLIDFGRTEFKRYTKHSPPHVKYILLEKTTELVCSIVLRLVAEMEKRGRILSQHNVTDISALPDDVYMPRLLVMIDEFGAFKAILSSDSFEERKTYRTHMEQLLRQGRKHGINFVFSDQSFTDTFRALPEEGQEQIGLRLTLLANNDEMKSILGVRGRQLTEKEESRINHLPKYQVLFRSRESGGALSEPVHVLYFTEADKDKQLELIDKLNTSLIPSAKSRSEASHLYVPREQFFLDRDATPSFRERSKEIRCDLENWKGNIGSLPTDVLLYLGEPRNMKKVHHELLRRIHDENLLVYGSYEKDSQGLGSIVYSIAQSAKLQNVPIEYWCAENDIIAKRFISSWGVNEEFLHGTDCINRRVHHLMAQMRDRSLSPRIVVVTGLADIMDAVQADLDEAALLGTQKSLSDEEKQIARIRALMAGATIDDEESDHEQPSNEYDMRNDIETLVHIAPKYGVHFVLLVQSEAELDSTTISTSNFSHKLGYASGVADVQHFKFKRFVESISEGDMCGCLSKSGCTVYMPFRI